MNNNPSLSRVSSISSLWRSWSPLLEPLSTYDKSRRDYPWLTPQETEENPLVPRPLTRAVPMPTLMSEVPDRRGSSKESGRDVENQSDPELLHEDREEDPNLVS